MTKEEFTKKYYSEKEVLDIVDLAIRSLERTQNFRLQVFSCYLTDNAEQADESEEQYDDAQDPEKIATYVSLRYMLLPSGELKHLLFIEDLFTAPYLVTDEGCGIANNLSQKTKAALRIARRIWNSED